MPPIKNLLLLATACIMSCCLFAQTATAFTLTPVYSPTVTTQSYQLGESKIQVKTLQYGDAKDIVYINLHADETSSIQAARIVLEKEGGTLIMIQNGVSRNIRFRLNGRTYQFDPNRIFSKQGIRQTLYGLGRYSDPAAAEIANFAERILRMIPENPTAVIALHNNTDGRFSIQSYVAGADRNSDALKVYANPQQDPDDIFLTTDNRLYEELAAAKFNSILQHNENAAKDGSLSVYCGEKNILYLNCETEHGKTEQYITMLKVAIERIIKITTPVASSYGCIIRLAEPAIIDEGLTVFDEDVKVGEIRSIRRIDSMTINCEMVLEKDYRLYTNRDLHLYLGHEGKPAVQVETMRYQADFPVAANSVLEIKLKN